MDTAEGYDQMEEKYGRLKYSLEMVLPWTVKIVTFSVGICGPVDQKDRKKHYQQ